MTLFQHLSQPGGCCSSCTWSVIWLVAKHVLFKESKAHLFDIFLKHFTLSCLCHTNTNLFSLWICTGNKSTWFTELLYTCVIAHYAWLALRGIWSVYNVHIKLNNWMLVIRKLYSGVLVYSEHTFRFHNLEINNENNPWIAFSGC